MSFPADWHVERRGDSIVVGGPPGHSAEFAAVSLQGLPRADQVSLNAAAEKAYAAVMHGPEAAWDMQSWTSVRGYPALLYAIRFTWHETARRRVGVLVDTGSILVDLSLIADRDVFTAGIPAFDRMLATMEIF